MVFVAVGQGVELVDCSVGQEPAAAVAVLVLDLVVGRSAAVAALVESVAVAEQVVGSFVELVGKCLAAGLVGRIEPVGAVQRIVVAGRIEPVGAERHIAVVGQIEPVGQQIVVARTAVVGQTVAVGHNAVVVEQTEVAHKVHPHVAVEVLPPLQE